MQNKKYLNKIYRYLNGECTPEEKRRLEIWLKEKPERQEMFEVVRKIWEVEPEKEIEANTQNAWFRLEEQMDKKEKNFPLFNIHHQRAGSGKIWVRVAAVFIIAILLSVYMTFYVANNTDQVDTEHMEMVTQEIRTNRGHQSEITFTDGTSVKLNSASYLRFPEKFNSNIREVYLEGEAWFDVQRNPNVEFVVKTHDATVRVLGTEFNVKAHNEESEVEVVVSEGKVAVQTLADLSTNVQKKVLLTQGEMSRVKRGEAPTPPEKIEVENYLSWLKGNFAFDKVPFFKVLNEWERRFDVDFIVEDQTLLNTPFTGEFKHESFDEILRLTSITLEFDYRREDNTILIK